MTYWEKRKDALYSQLEKDELALRKRLLKNYQAESARLEKEIAAYFSKYGEDNVIEYRKLLQKLDPEDQALLFEQWDEFAKKYPQYQDLMPIRTSIYQLDRLQGLQYSISLQQLELGASEQSMIEDHLSKTARRAANMTMETLGFGKNFYAIDSDVVKLFVGTNWSGDGDFSSRIWKNKEKISNYVNTDLAQGFARGDSYARLVKDIQSRFLKVSKNDAYRLVYTEGSFVANEASMYPFQEYFTEYSIQTMGDGKVCPICKAISEQSKIEPFNIESRTPGENFPPFHPWCRCTFKIEVDDWQEWMDNYVATGGNPKQAQQIKQRISNPIGKLPEDVIKKSEVEFAVSKSKNITEQLEKLGIEKIEIKKYTEQVTQDIIIKNIAGGDMTDGSCSSTALTYIANKLGYNMRDFRGGKSLDFFSAPDNIKQISTLFSERNVLYENNDFLAANICLSSMTEGKEYFFTTGEHAAIVKRVGDGFQYLELQSPNAKGNGYKKLTESKLRTRFACNENNSNSNFTASFAIDSLKDEKSFIDIMQYINTNSEMKGASGALR